MILAIILIAVALIVVVGLILIRRAGGGKFPWLQFYLRGRESGFAFREINLIRRVAVEARLEDPTALFWSVKQLDRAIKGFIIKYRSRGEEQGPEYNALLAKLFELRKKVEFDLPKYKMGIKSSRKLLKNQVLRLSLPGAGPFVSKLIENTARYMAIEYPRGPKLPEGFTWKAQKVGVYFWKAEDAGYFFQTKVLEDHSDKKYPILWVAHADNLVRTQKRQEVRVETDLAAELFPLRSIAESNETPDPGRGLRCRIVDLSEGGIAIHIGGKARVGLPVKIQFEIGDSRIIMSGVVKGLNYDQKKNRSLLHVQASQPSTHVRNRLLIYVFNLFGEREAAAAGRQPEAHPVAPAADSADVPDAAEAEPENGEPSVDLE
jgi:c-di-GMP-binding flagellar brake protein YcgR